MKRIVRRVALALVGLIMAGLVLTPLARAQETQGFHPAYLCGYPDGTIRPEESLTREALAQALYRLMDAAYLEKLGPCEGTFSDVPPDRWSYRAVSTLAQLGLVMAGEDGSFCPERGVRGEELALTLVRIADTQAGRDAFGLLAERWKAQEVTFAAGCGWAAGLQDGVFAPDTALTRAQFAQIMNGLLGRTPQSLEDLLIGMPVFSDNADTRQWYFLDLQEAAAGHTYKETDGHETWTGLG